MPSLGELLEASAVLHRHLCPRQVLGVRIGMYAGEILGLELPQSGKRLLTIVETDGCAVDGIAVATNCSLGHRTLRVEDYGKVAATFVDTGSGNAVRIVPRRGIRDLATKLGKQEGNPWAAQRLGYQWIPASILLSATAVVLTKSLAQILSQPGRKAKCSGCGEEILNERELVVDGQSLCRACAGEPYYQPVDTRAGFRPGSAQPESAYAGTSFRRA